MGKGILEVESDISDKVRDFEAAGEDSTQVFADLLDLWVETQWRNGAVSNPNILAQSERALELQTQLNGAGSLATYQSLYNLGVVYAEQGKYPLSLPYFERAHECKVNAGVSAGEIAHSIHAMGNICYLTGDVPQALEHYEKALEMLVQTYGEEHQNVAKTMGSLGNVYANLGAIEIADRLVRRSLEILEKAVPEDKGTLLAYTLVDFAEVLAKQGNDVEAADVIRHAIALMDSSGLEDHPHISMEYNDLGVIYHDRLEFDQARYNYKMAVDLRDDVGSNPTSFGLLLNQANLKVDQGEWSQAFEEYAFINNSLKNGVGEGHPLSQIANVNEAMAHLLFGDLETAVSAAIEAETRMRANARQFAGAFSSAQALNYERIRPSGLDPVLSATKLSVEDDPASLRFIISGWDMLIRSRAYILDELAYRHQVLKSSEDAALDSLRLEYQALATLQADHFFAGSQDARSIGTLNRVRQELEGVDRHLGRLSSKHRVIQERHQLSEQIGFEKVLEYLPPSSALVGFVRFGNITPIGSESDQRKETEWQSLPNVGILTRPGKTEAAYAAYVVRAGAKEPEFIYLGSAETIETEIAAWKKDIESRGDQTPQHPGSRVRELIWDPIESSVREADLIFLVPDGDINHVSFDALPVEGDKFVCETAPLIHYLSAERDLLTETQTPSGRGLLVVGRTRLLDKHKRGSRRPRQCRRRNLSRVAILHRHLPVNG